jgi:surface polysaccharide O-acyltransferase-like enzyme
MTATVRRSADWVAVRDMHVPADSRDDTIDTMRGIAILMVIGIHSLQRPLDTPWATAIDAALRPCVPVFLFASGYLTALSGRVPLARRLKATLIPYATAFAAAYIYMTLHNSAMDHRLIAALARFGLAYVFVYYYVFVYVGCTVVMWLIFAVTGTDTPEAKCKRALFLTLAIGAGLIFGSYLDPTLSRLGFSDSVIDEVRMRDIPFWFSFMAAGALTAMYARVGERSARGILLGVMLIAYVVYAAVRIFTIGDAAAYDSIAYFAYAALLCFWLFAIQPRSPPLATIGSGSYFIYLWHIFFVMVLRDHAALRQFGPALNSAITYVLTVSSSVLVLLAVRQIVSRPALRWLGG